MALAILLLYLWYFYHKSQHGVYISNPSTTGSCGLQPGQITNAAKWIFDPSSATLRWNFAAPGTPWGTNAFNASIEPIPSIVQWNKIIYQPLFFLNSKSLFKREGKIKCQRRPTIYDNSTATFEVELVGDLVFKLNPGPATASSAKIPVWITTNRQRNTTRNRPSNGSLHKIWSAHAHQFPIPQHKIAALYTNIENPIPALQISWSSLRSQQNFCNNSRNQHNLVHINCSSVLAVNECNQSKPMSLSLVNIRSVKSKSADFFWNLFLPRKQTSSL